MSDIRTSFTLSDAQLRTVIEELQAGFITGIHNSAGLVVGSSAAAKIKIANTINGVIGNVPVTAATSENTLTTAHSVTNAAFNVLVLSIVADGTVTTTAGTEGASLAAVVWPTVPALSAVIGYVIINPTGTGNFVGGTTELTDATVVPNAVYVNSITPVNPNMSSL